ncbi:hypothetical protein [Plantactinospora sp. GCM10030261]|uniref:hypothetical protein n=1 Tax=Plantactinospora sp. GCM10030261 TaxID=3273420 RepID=UPI0036088201
METTLPAPLRQALTVTTAGATGVARMVIDGLLELADDRAAMAAAIDHLTARLTGYAPLWHIAKAVRATDPAVALRRIRTDLDDAVARSVATATDWVRDRPGPVEVAPSSSIVSQVLARLGDRFPTGRPPGPGIGLAGADAIGPKELLNIVGTRELTERVPVLIVTTSLKLVPEETFARLGAPVFERIPLDAVAGIVLDGELVDPREAGRRAAALPA